MTRSSPASREFVRLLLHSEPRIYAFIRSQIPHRVDAEDVLQETVTLLWSKWSDFRPDSDFLAWGYQVARFKVRHYYRNRAKENRLFSESFVELVADKADAMAHEFGGMQDTLAGCMGKMKADDRDLVQRCYGTGATIRSVADDLGRPIDTIKSVLKRCRRALYECVRRTLATEVHP